MLWDRQQSQKLECQRTEIDAGISSHRRVQRWTILAEPGRESEGVLDAIQTRSILNNDHGNESHHGNVKENEPYEAYNAILASISDKHSPFLSNMER